MLKLQQRGTEKTIWLVGPLVKLGSARTNDFVIAGTSIEPHHCSLHISEEGIIAESMEGAVTYLNEKQIKGKLTVDAGDVLRIVNHEFVIIDPANKAAATSAVMSKESPVSSEATVFRAAPVVSKENTPNQASGWLLQGLHKSLQNKRYPIEGTVVLGRTSECELAFSYDRLSRRHAELKVIDGVLVVRDLDSSNGTYVNGEKIKQATLHHGDTLALDKLEFAVVGPSSANAASPEKALSQTIVRPAINPSAVKQANNGGQKKIEEKAIKADEVASKTGIIIVAVAVVIVALLAFVFLIK